jgi:hypothetical protein
MMVSDKKGIRKIQEVIMKRRNFLVLLVMLVFVFTSVSLIAEETKSKQVVVEKIQKIKNPGSDFQVKLAINKKDAAYKEGEEIKLKFKSTKDCYLTLIDVGTDGNVTIFFPNKYHKDNKIKAGKVYYIPQKGAKWLLRVKGPAGKEVIKAIATLEKKDLVKKEDLKPAADEEVFQVVDEKKRESFAKNISVELKPVDTKKWAEAEQIIKVEEKEKKKEVK